MINIYNKGISLIEIIIIISIIGILSAITIPILSDFKKSQSLKNTTENVISILNKAKADSNSSLDSSNYGVHFETNKAVYFKGITYSSSSSSNKEVVFDSGIIIPASLGLSLSGGGSNIIFPKLTGDVVGYGSIKLQQSSDVSSFKTITVSKLGVIETQ